MKKLLCTLLIVAVLVALAVPAFAMEASLDLQIEPEVTATAFGVPERNEIYDEETKEFIGYGPEWIRYSWQEYCGFNVTINGEKQRVTLNELRYLVQTHLGIDTIWVEVLDPQSVDNQWELGGTYDVTMRVDDYETWENIATYELKVTIVPPPVDIQISKITMDELLVHEKDYGDGQVERYYDWYREGTADITIDGVQHERMSVSDLRELLYKNYGEAWCSYSLRFIDPEGNVDYKGESEWEVGDVFEADITLYNSEQVFYRGRVLIEIVETEIASVTAKPVTYYSCQGGAFVDLTINYKDGSTADYDLGYWVPGEWPTEPGQYTVLARLDIGMDVPVQVTVLPDPTSGKLGENVNWVYDAETETLTISGTGDTYYMNENIDDGSDEYNDWENLWSDLLLSMKPKRIVVEEGITGLMPGVFMNAPFVETLSLPSTLKKLPMGLIGLNGPSYDADLGLGIESAGLKTFVVPEFVTKWDQNAFCYCWGVTDIYLPAGLESLNLENLIYTIWMRQAMGLEPVETTIHFAGTEAQWNAVELFVPEVAEEYQTALQLGLSMQEAMEYLKTCTIKFEDPAEVYGKDEGEEDAIVDGVFRIYGSNRFDTAFGAANMLKETLGVEKFENIIVACGTNFADALAGSYLGKVKNAPILLVQPNMVPAVREYIEANLQPGGTVYLLGGETIVPGGVSEGLTQFTTKRLWGANRYETNLAILEEAGVTGGEILVCTGYGFADSLSASAVGKPILLVDKKLTAGQEAYLAGLTDDSYVIVGGIGAVNEVVEESLRGYGAIERLAGANRFATSVMVAERFFDNPTNAVVAYAANFPDGLCGGPLAMSMGGPLLLTANNDAAITAAYTEANSICDGVVLGGPGLISDTAVRQIFGMEADAPIAVK